MNTLKIDTSRKNGWVARWTKLNADRSKNDFAIADLAREIRDEFPKGDAGDFQFSVWVLRHLPAARPKKLLEKAFSVDTYGEEEFTRLGGWQSISFLMSLTKAQQKHVLSTVHGEGPFHYSTIRMRALRLGIVSPRKGRDTRSQSEDRVSILRQFILKLYKQRKDLPPLPADVRAAITPTVLSALGSTVSA